MCLPGQSQHLTQRSTCEGCLVGKYADQPGASGCLQCGVGTFQKETGKTFCLPCNPGPLKKKKILFFGKVVLILISINRKLYMFIQLDFFFIWLIPVICCSRFLS